MAAVGSIIVDPAAQEVKFLSDDGLEVPNALLGEEWQQDRLAELVEVVVGGGEERVWNVLAVDEVFRPSNSARAVERVPVGRVDNVQLVRSDPDDWTCSS